jgi:uncharacterized protein YndB with AHSA1/START domain
VNRTVQIAPVRKSVLVRATPAEAFEAFSGRIDRWWPKDKGIGPAPIVESIIEPFVGGRWHTRCKDGTDVTIGHVRAWEPGRRLVVSWEISADWKPDARAELASEVEVRFLAADEGMTRVELEHRNFERLAAPGGEKMRKDVDNGWPAMLELYAKEAQAPGARP